MLVSALAATLKRILTRYPLGHVKKYRTTMKLLLPTGHPNFVEAEVVRTKRHRDVWRRMRLHYASPCRPGGRHWIDQNAPLSSRLGDHRERRLGPWGRRSDIDPHILGKEGWTAHRNLRSSSLAFAWPLDPVNNVPLDPDCSVAEPKAHAHVRHELHLTP